MKKVTILLMALAFTAIGCKKETETTPAEETVVTEETTTETIVDEVVTDIAETTGDKVVLEIASDDMMKFDKTELKAKAGETVEIKFTHTGKLPKETMGHNIVFLKKGVDITAFATEALAAKDNEYIPTDAKDVLAHSKLIGGGETDTFSFTAPEAGTYDFLCTFPGHNVVMRGKFIVE